MKTQKILAKTFILALAAGILVTGCKKKEEDDKDTTASSDNAFAESSYNDVANIADQAGNMTANGNYNYKMGDDQTSLLANCATVSFFNVNKLDSQDTIVVDFGTAGCTGNDGRTRKGQVIIYYSGKWKQIGSTHTITFNNYYVNDNKIDGSKTVKTNAFNGAGHMNWTVTVNGTITLASGGGTVTWTSSRTRELLAGQNADSTITWASSKWGITGTASGTSAKGTSYTANITSQLVRDFTCSSYRRHFVAGTFEFTPSGKATRTVDFGSGACDDDAIVTIKGKSYPIKLK